jgi:hypothetical protein
LVDLGFTPLLQMPFAETHQPLARDTRT